MFSNWAQVWTPDCAGRRGAHHRPVHHLPLPRPLAWKRLSDWLWGSGSASLMPESPEVRGPVVGPLEGSRGPRGGLGASVGTPLTTPCLVLLQFWLTMSYLAQMTEEQTLAMYSGHPLGLFPSSPEAPRLVLTNGMVGPGAAGRPSHQPPAEPSPPKATVRPPALRPPLSCRSFPTTPPGQTTRSSLPWGLPCEYCRFIARPYG